MRLANVVAPSTTEQFRQEYLDKQWTVFRGAHGRYEQLVPWSELNTVLRSLRIPSGSNRLRLVRDGHEVPATEYIQPHQMWGGLILTGVFERLLSEGATLVLNGVHELFGSIRQLAQDAETVTKRHAWVNLYAGWRRQKGFDLHWDDHDTLVLQVHGRKAWTVYAPTCEYPVKDFPGSQVKPHHPPVWEGILESGSMLYMPRGWWHVAVPLDEPTLHVTLGLKALAGQDVVRWLAAQLSSCASYRRDLPDLGGAEDEASYLAALKNAISAMLTTGCLDRVRQFSRAEIPGFAEFDLPRSITSEPTLAPESVVALAGARGFDTTRSQDGRMHSGTGDWTCDAAIVRAFERLNESGAARFSELCLGLDGSHTAELKRLLVAMHLEGIVVIRQESVHSDALSRQAAVA